jgi:3-isopropylmalate/(R)-2-methylmalate dehydratase small subunit
MESFQRLSSRIFTLPEANIDTDQIIPARFLTAVDREGLAGACFHDWRFGPGGVLTAHPLNELDVGTHRILVAGHNFGCGSSREHAPWALLAFGFRAVISTGIADIFTSNALKNGLLPIEVDAGLHRRLLASGGEALEIDLERECLRFGGEETGFSIEPFARRCLLAGEDSLDVLIGALPEIEAFEAEKPF